MSDKEYCGKCGNYYAIGEWPWCPHGKAEYFGEEPLEPYIDEHLTSEPEGIEITTRSQRRKIMDRNNIEYRRKIEKPPGHTLYFFT